MCVGEYGKDHKHNNLPSELVQKKSNCKKIWYTYILNRQAKTTYYLHHGLGERHGGRGGGGLLQTANIQ